MQTTLVIFSGLPGTGKSTLANRLARELRWPLLRIDDVAASVPEDADISFWDSRISELLRLTEAQLELGVSVILDSVFMNTDRHYAQNIARKYQARFRPIYIFVSDDKVWKQRVTARFNDVNDKDIATWEQIQHQRLHFQKWEPDTALFIDALNPIEENYSDVFRFVINENVTLKPLANVPLIEGRYHG